MDRKEFEFILEQGEDQFIEFKEKPDRSLSKEIVAFANARGGKILVGITDKGEIKGIDATNTLKSQIIDIATNCDPPIKVDIKTYRKIVIIGVEEGRKKPYACSQGFFLRIGANSQKLKRNEIRGFFQEEGGILFDEKFIDFDFEDLSKEAYDNFLVKAKINSNLEQKQLLSNLRFLKNGKLNHSGVLFFAKDIRNYLPNATINCLLYQGTTRTNIIDKKEFYGDLVSNYENALNYFKANLRTEFVIRSMAREEYLELPEVALRETLINAIAHRDYFSSAPILINIFYDRIEIINPVIMDPAIKFEDLYRGTFPRNLLLFANLEKIDLVEHAGSGFIRIEKAMDEYKLTFPEVKFSKRLFEVIFKRPDLQTNSYRVRVIEGKDIEKDLRKATQKATQKTTQKTTQKIIALIRERPQITRKELAQEIGLTEDGIKYHLRKMQERGIIKRIGPDKGGHWEVVE